MRRLRRWWWRYVRGYRYEICHKCGRPVGVVWLADDELWAAIAWYVLGRGGILCMRCFDAGAVEMGMLLYWVPSESVTALR